jgi:hypothetical protein
VAQILQIRNVPYGRPMLKIGLSVFKLFTRILHVSGPKFSEESDFGVHLKKCHAKFFTAADFPYGNVVRNGKFSFEPLPWRGQLRYRPETNGGV